VARKLVELLRASDVVGMIGEDLAVILVHTPDTDALGITERLTPSRSSSSPHRPAASHSR